jgi:tol-pal system protein YbgF
LALGLLAIVAVPPPAWSQDSSVNDRLDRLERDLNMLQRQVYRGGAPAETADSSDAGGGNPNAAVNLDIRMDRLEQQMRELTGRVEEYGNAVTQLRQKLEQINSDIDVRFNQLQGTAGAASPAPGPLPRNSAAAAAAPSADQGGGDRDGDQQEPGDSGADSGGGGLTPPTSLMPPGTAVPGPGAPQAIFNTLTPPGAGPSPAQQAEPQVASTEGGGASAPGRLPGGSPSKQYNYAFGLLKQADYPAAEAALQAFVTRHPNDPMASNAQYFLGETFYTRGRFADAATAFAEGFKRYPKSARAPNDLLMLGLSLSHDRQKQNACLALDQLDHGYPNAARLRARAATERKRLGCSS